MLQLLPNEAFLYEYLDTIKSIPQIVRETGMSKDSVVYLLGKLIELEAVKKSGIRGKRAYTAIPQQYEIVEKRQRITESMSPDPYLEEAMNVKLTSEQQFYIMMHRKVLTRSELAKRLGLSKMQLNFAILAMEKE